MGDETQGRNRPRIPRRDERKAKEAHRSILEQQRVERLPSTPMRPSPNRWPKYMLIALILLGVVGGLWWLFS